MDFISELIAAIGGAVSVTLILLGFSKNLLQKWIETTIDTTAEQSLTKYANALERKTKAYELLLEKEFYFFESASEFMSNTIIDIQSISRHLISFSEEGTFVDLGVIKETAERIMGNVQVFKRDTLLLQSFLSEEIFLVSTDTIQHLQRLMPLLSKIIDYSNELPLSKDDIDTIKKAEEFVLSDCVILSLKIKNRLVELSTD